MRWVVCWALALAACHESTGWPGAALHAVSPDRIRTQTPAELDIRGANLFGDLATGVEHDSVRTNRDFRGWLGGGALADVVWVSNEMLRGTAPPLPEGIYDLEIETPSGDLLVLERAVAVDDEATVSGGGHGDVEDFQVAGSTMSPSATMVEETLSPAVNPERSILFFNVRHDSVMPHDGHISGQIVDGGATVRFQRHGTGVSIEIAWTVLQHSDLRVQRGTTVHPSSPTSVLLAQPVPLERTLVIATLCISGGNYNWNDWVRAELTDPSTLVLSSGIDEQNPNAFVDWQVITFVPEAEAVVVRENLRLANGALAARVPTSAVPSSSFLLVSQHSIQSHNVAAHNQVRGRFDGGYLSFDRVAASIDIDLTAYVVTWPSIAAQHGTLHFSAGEARRRATIDPCPSSRAAVVTLLPSGMRQGRSALDWDDGVGGAWFTSTLDGCDVVLERGDTDAEADGAWTVFWIE